MNQKRLKERLEKVSGQLKQAKELLEKTDPEKISFRQITYGIWLIEPVEYALRKSVEKTARMEGERAHCPDCGTSVRFSDNYCRKCGQRLVIKKGGKRCRQRK